MRLQSILRPGDPVEFRFVTQDGEIWHPAKVVSNDEVGLTVAAYDTGRRHTIEHDVGDYRLPASTQKAVA